MKKSWEHRKLGEVCNISTGKANANEAVEDGKYAFFDRSKKVKKSNEYLFDCTALIIPGEGAQFFPKFYSGKFNLHQRAYALFDFDSSVDIRFVEYALIFDHKYFERVAVGATVKSLRLRHFQNFELALPSLSEQKRIVKILDKKFEAIRKLEKVTGKQLVDAEELFESRTSEIFNNKNWKESQFDDVCVLQRGFDLPTRLRKKGDRPLVSANGITDYIDQFKVVAPGVTTGRSGSIGSVHFIEKDFWPLNTALYIKDFKGNDEKFIYYFLKHFDLSRFSSGAGVPTLNRNNVHSEMVRIPNEKSEQQQVVIELDLLVKNIEELKRVLKVKLVELEELKRSYLEQAFAGNL